MLSKNQILRLFCQCRENYIIHEYNCLLNVATIILTDKKREISSMIAINVPVYLVCVGLKFTLDCCVMNVCEVYHYFSVTDNRLDGKK